MSVAVSPLPRASFIAVLTILGGAMLWAGAARFAGFASPQPPPPVIAAVDLNFADLPNGGIAITDTDTNRVISTVAPRAGGFLRSTMRVLATERGDLGLGPQQPFRLTELQGNRLRLTDTATGQSLELEAFGPSNAAEFFSLLTAAETPQ